MLLKKLQQKSLIHPPRWLIDNCHYLTYMGSHAYAIANMDSDRDVYGWCIPPRDVVFPHTAGIIKGFGNQGEKFEQWSQHHIENKSARVEYDFSVYSIVKYFQLLMENNPNILDSLFVPRRCIIHSTQIAERVRENRKLFLHKGSYHKHKGYAYSQLQKIKNKTNSTNPKRAEVIERVGYDTKFATHLVRLLNQSEYILIHHDLDLEINNEQLKSIRRGDWTLEQVEEYFVEKEKVLEQLYVKSDLRNEPDEQAIKNLLFECLEMHYGSLDTVITKPDQYQNLISDLEHLVSKYR